MESSTVVVDEMCSCLLMATYHIHRPVELMR